MRLRPRFCGTAYTQIGLPPRRNSTRCTKAGPPASVHPGLLYPCLGRRGLYPRDWRRGPARELIDSPRGAAAQIRPGQRAVFRDPQGHAFQCEVCSGTSAPEASTWLRTGAGMSIGGSSARSSTGARTRGWESKNSGACPRAAFSAQTGGAGMVRFIFACGSAPIGTPPAATNMEGAKSGVACVLGTGAEALVLAPVLVSLRPDPTRPRCWGCGG